MVCSTSAHPITNANAGTSLVITAPAPINEYFPSSLPHTIVAFAPIDTPFLTFVVLNSPLNTGSDFMDNFAWKTFIDGRVVHSLK